MQEWSRGDAVPGGDRDAPTGSPGLLALFACAEDPRVADILALEGDPLLGATLFAENCQVCHGADGSGASGPAIDHPHSREKVVKTMLRGPYSMPSFADLDDAELADLLAHVTELGIAEPL